MLDPLTYPLNVEGSLSLVSKTQDRDCQKLYLPFSDYKKQWFERNVTLNEYSKAVSFACKMG